MKAAWVIYPNRRPDARLRLICIPQAGAGVAVCRPWAESLDSQIELGAVRLPGRESRLREAPFTQLIPLAEGLAAAVGPTMRSPFALFGHCSGAVIAFEFARALRRAGFRLPFALYVSDCGAPDVIKPERLSSLPTPRLVEHLRRLGDTPAAVLDNEEFHSIVLPAIRADFALLEGYRHSREPPLDCAIRAIATRRVSNKSLSALRRWERHTSDGFRLERTSAHAWREDSSLLAFLSQDMLQCAKYRL